METAVCPDDHNEGDGQHGVSPPFNRNLVTVESFLAHARTVVWTQATLPATARRRRERLDRTRLTYHRAERLFRTITGYTLHQLRHSGLPEPGSAFPC
jgi:hypothetical protein